MVAYVELGGMRVAVTQKAIKHVHLSVYPPAGRVRISAPLHMELDTIRIFAISKLAWIRSQQKKIRAQEREAPREYLNRESHYLWGKRYLLKMQETEAAPKIETRHRHLVLSVRAGSEPARCQDVLDAWYREQIRTAIEPLLEKWQPVMGVMAGRIFVQRMKTKWGSCNPQSGNIRLNTDLAKKPPECLEYILVHELAHLIEPSHNARFIALMEKWMPHWRHLKAELNRLPVRHEDWDY